MTLEEIIKYAVIGIIFQGGMPDSMNDDIQELLQILIDYPDITDKDLISILSGKWLAAKNS